MFLFPFSFWQIPEANSLKGNLLAYYNFRTFANTGTTISDVASRIYNLSPVGDMQFGPGKVQIISHPAQFDLSFYCTGNNYLQVKAPAFDITGDKTFAFWINGRGDLPDTFLAEEFFSNGSTLENSPSGGYYFAAGNGSDMNPSFTIQMTDGTQVGTFGMPIATITGIWHFFVTSIDYNKRIISTLMDNAYLASGFWFSGVFPAISSGFFHIGTVPPNNARGNSYIDEFSIWNRQLTNSEKTYLWNNGSGRTFPFNI